MDEVLETFDEWLTGRSPDAHTISVIIQWRNWNKKSQHDVHYVNYEQLLELFEPEIVQ